MKLKRKSNKAVGHCGFQGVSSRREDGDRLLDFSDLRSLYTTVYDMAKVNL